MAIPFAQPIKRLGAYPVDESLVRTKAQMLAAVDTEMPIVYLCIGEEDGKLYLYDKRNDVDPVTGKYRVFEGGQGGNYAGLGGIVVDNDARTISIDQSVIATVEAVNAALAEKADAADVYDIATIDTLLSRLEDEIGNKADKENTFTKEEVLALIPDVSDLASKQELADGLSDKADASNVYTKEQEDAKLAEKADKADTYTKEQTDEFLDEKADKADLDNKASLTVGKISTAGGGEEVHAIVAQGDNAIGLNYYKQGQEAPGYVNLSINDDFFSFRTAAAIDDMLAQKPSLSLEPEYKVVTLGTDTELLSFTEQTDDVLIQMARPGEYESAVRVPRYEHMTALLAEKQDVMQLATVPEASADNEGKVIQFIGATSSTFTNGFFYRCREVTPATDPKTFEWVRVDVQPASGVGGGDATVYRYPDGTIYAVRNLDPTTGAYEGGNEVSFTKTEDGIAVSASKDFTEDFSEELVNKAFVDAGLDIKANKSDIPFVATYEATTYDEVKAAIDANRAIVINFPNNNNLICVTYATYTTGQNIVMSGIYKYGNDISATGLTLTPANAWSVSNEAIATKQEVTDGLALKADKATTYTKTEVDDLIPDVSGFATQQDLTDGLALKADAADTYTKTEVDALIPDVSDFATEQELTDGLALKADSATTYTKTEVDGLLDDKADTATTYTKGEVDALLPDMTDYYDKTETDALLAVKADAADFADYYTKTQVDALLDDKADASAVYTKGETDTLLADKADADSVYDKTETDALLAAKANASAVYTKTEADALLSGKADSADLDGYYDKATADALLDAKADKSTTYTKTETDTLLDEKASKSSVPEVTASTTSTGMEFFVGNTNPFTYEKKGLGIKSAGSGLAFTVSAYGGAPQTVTVPNDMSLMGKANVADLVATDNKIGNLGNLQTNDKTNLVGAVNEVNGKAGVHFEVDAEKWYGTYKDENGVTYQVYTKTVYIPALPATAGITTYQHGISGIKQILSAYGFTTDGFVLNAPRQTASDNIAIYQVQKSATGGIAIEVGKDRSNKSAYVTLIYAKNN